tara:strand:- start:663 stop:995 length:333 start_codon:yes stop_codon:yes gene_type:complete
MKKVKFGNNEIFDQNGKKKKTRLYPLKRSNKNEKIKTISKSIIQKYYKKIIRKCKNYYYKKIIFYYYYKQLKYKYELLFSKLTDDDPIINELIQDIINTYNDIILDIYYT